MIKLEKIKKNLFSTGKIVTSFLEVIYDMSQKETSFLVTRRDLWNTINGYHSDSNYSKSKFNSTIHNLQNSGYLKLSGDIENQSIEFTNKARMKIIDSISGSRATVAQYKFVSFDIPEHLRKNRDAFRRILKKIGFIKIQKSLWACNKSIGDLVEIAAYEYGVEKYVVYIASEKSDIDGIIQRRLSGKGESEILKS